MKEKSKANMKSGMMGSVTYYLWEMHWTYLDIFFSESNEQGLFKKLPNF